MRHFRQTFLWLLSATLVLSGVMGRGFVLCVPADGTARLEVSGEDGRCQQDGGVRADAAGHAAAALAGDSLRCHGCEDVTLSAGIARVSAAGANPFSAVPPLVPAATIPQHHAAAEFEARPARPRARLASPHSSDVYAVRTTVALII